MNCGHNSYQCGPTIVLQNQQGEPVIYLPQWCTVCGTTSLRLPQVHEGDMAVIAAHKAIIKAPPTFRPGHG